EPGEHSHGDSEAAARTLAAMGFDPSKVSTGGATLTQAAGDAKLSVNGRQISSPHNLIEDEASGLTIRLNGATEGSAKIHVETDTAAMA
ncbi:flagellar filament capping protein FliD, partial [Vibrio vulnificus]|uniref:flagellar filament capping protein FliD n=1 Tax=Vibrio vulnificus TaxID=672 RepID=UPI00188AD5B1